MPIIHPARQLLLAGALLLLSAAANAQIRYVAPSGKDGNNCQTQDAACRTLQRGINMTPAGGELRILGSGGYGNAALINKTMTISADNETVMLNAPLTIDSFAIVTLRGLSLNGRDRVSNGIHIADAAAVHIDKCTVEHFTANGIQSVRPGTRLFVTDSASRNNGGHGLYMTSSATAWLTVDNSRFENNRGTGILGESTEGSIARTVAAGNQNGIWWAGSVNVVSSMAASNSGGGYVISAGRMFLESSVAHNNGFVGLQVRSAGSVASISNFVVTGSQRGIVNEGTLLTRQNNTLDGNSTGISGNPPTPFPPPI